MKKLFSRTLALALCAAMLLCCLPQLPVFAASSYPNTHVNTGNMAADIVAVAVTQAGYCEGSLSGNPSYASTNNYQKFGQWYDQNVDNIGVTRAAWCAAFVSWCANQAGVPSSIVYYHAYCPYGVNWFRNQGRFRYAASRGGSYVPKAGDIVYFAPAGSSTSSHVGIVRYVSNGYVYTVEGNTGGQNGEVNEGGGVFLKSYSLSYSRLYGYGTPAYTDNSGHTVTFDSNGGSSVANVNVKDGSTLTAPANPTRYGFNFVGWYCDPGLNDPYNFSTPVSYGFTLYAKWEEAYWGANTDLMPVDGLLVRNDFQSTGQYIWPYYNDDGSVTMYNGVTNDSNWSWPSAYMSYENTVDLKATPNLHLNFRCDYGFNGEITYLDETGAEHTVNLSTLADLETTDFTAGTYDLSLEFASYIEAQGHMPSDGILKLTRVTYYVVGVKDSYARLYDLSFCEAKAVPEIKLSYPTVSFEDMVCYNIYYTATKALVVAALNYGAEAQKLFSYRTDSLMNSSLTASQQALVEAYRSDMMDTVPAAEEAKAGIFTKTDGFSRKYPTVTFEGAFCINYHFVPSATPTGNVKLYYWTQADYEAAETLTPANASGSVTAVCENGVYTATVAGIAAKDLDKGIYVAAGYTYDGGSHCTGILAYSIGTYCTASAAGSDTAAALAAATAVYGYYAKGLFY